MFTFARSAATVTIALALIVSSARSATAQVSAEPETKKLEFRVTGGGLVAVGSQRDFIKDAQLTAAQLSWLVRPSLAITGTFGWARSRDIASVDAHRLDVFASDVGLEFRPRKWFADHKVTFSPFVGLGAGARSYNYRKLDMDATNNLAGYASLGGELGVGKAGIRLEVRDYLSGFKPLSGIGESDVRNDLLIIVGLRFNKKRSAQQ